MSIAKKEEICSSRLGPQLGEPAVGVPIKKRPVSFSDNSAASGIPISMMPLSTAPEMSVPAAGAGFGKECFINFARPDTNTVTKGKGITNSQIQDHANRPFTTLSMTTGNRVPLNGASESPSTESAAPVNASQRQRLLGFDLRLPSYQSGKTNTGSVVKEEKAEQIFLGFSSAQHQKNVQTESVPNVLSSSSFDNLPNLDLNEPFDPADSLEGLPKMHEKRSGLYPGTIQHQTDQMHVTAPISTINSELSRNTNSTLNLSDSSKLSHKSGPGDVTLDLQLKPPARPELGVNWKGLAPAPELSLSLFGKPTTEPKDLSTRNLLFSLEPAGNSKKISEEPGIPGSAKSPVEKIAKSVPCNAEPQNTASSVVSGSVNMVSKSLVKKEPEEASQQPNLNDVEKDPLSQQQSGGLVRSCPASKTGFDLNSDIFPNNSIHDALDVATDSVTIPAESLPGIVPTETLPGISEVQKYVKCEETVSATLNPAVATASGHSVPPAAAKSSPLEGDSPSPAAGLCDLISQQPISISEPSCSSADYKPPASHLHSHDVTCEALGSRSNPVAQPSVLNSRDRATIDGMSQGSAEMDCSDDDVATISRLPTADKPPIDPLGTKDGADAKVLCTKLQKEHETDTPQDCSSSAKIVNEESKEKQSLNADNDSKNDFKTAAGSSSTDPQKASALQISASLKMESTIESSGPSDRFEKTRSPEIKSARSPHCEQASSCSKDNAKLATVKAEHQTESEDITKQSDFRSRDPVLGEDSDKASSSQPNSESGKVKSASEMSEHDKSIPDSCRTSSLQNERAGHYVGYAYVNRNERWERFMESEREKNKGDYHGGRHASDMIKQRRTDHRYGGRGGGSHGHHPRSFRGPRMSNESEIAFADEHISGRRRPFDDDLEHLQRIPHRRRRGCLMRDMDTDGFSGREIPGPRLIARGQMEDLPDDMIEDRLFMPHSRQHHAPGDHGFIQRERSHSPVQRRGAPGHFHRGRSPEAMHRSPSLGRTERTYLHHRRHTRRHGSPLDRAGHDERGMQRHTRGCGIIGSHQALEEDAFELPLHPAHLAEFHAEEELAHRRRYGERRAYLRPLEAAPVGEEEDMLSYHSEDGDMEFEGDGPREVNGCFRNRFGHRARGEQEDGYRQQRGPQGWRDGDSNGSRPKRRRY